MAYDGIEMEFEIKPGVKKRHVVGKLSPEEIQIVEDDLAASKRAKEMDFIVGGPLPQELLDKLK